MAHPKHEQVRQRYAFCCGYCGVSETDAAGELTVDHYCPVSAGGDNSDDNLVYACVRCNIHKGVFWPDAAAQAQGQRILHPQRDDIAAHLWENVMTGQLEPLTDTGRVHIAILDLNRPALIAHRLKRWRAQTALEIQRSMADELAEAHTLIEALRRDMARMEQVQNRLQNESDEGQ